MEPATLMGVVGAVLGLMLFAWIVLIIFHFKQAKKAKASAGAGAGDGAWATAWAGAADPEEKPEVPLEARLEDTQQNEEVIVPETVQPSAPQEPEPFLPQDAHGYHWDAPGETYQDTSAKHADKMQVDKTGVNDDQKCWSCACTAQGQPAA